MKRWLGVFLLAAAVRAWGADADAAARIKAVLDADAKIEAEMAAQGGDEPRATDAARAKIIVEKMKAIDLAACPDDFQDAYRRHIDAWARYVQLVDGLADAASHDAVIETKLLEILAAIESTFGAVEDIARRNGVDIPEEETDAAPAP